MAIKAEEPVIFDNYHKPSSLANWHSHSDAQNYVSLSLTITFCIRGRGKETTFVHMEFMGYFTLVFKTSSALAENILGTVFVD